jgi:hypothetical protein
MAFLLEIRPKALFFAPTGQADGRTGQNRVVLPIFCSRKGLYWQPASRVEFGPQRIFAALANRVELLTKPPARHPRLARAPRGRQSDGHYRAQRPAVPPALAPPARGRRCGTPPARAWLRPSPRAGHPGGAQSASYPGRYSATLLTGNSQHKVRAAHVTNGAGPCGRPSITSGGR